MPTPAKDRLRLQIAGRFHENWTSYDVDSDLLIPADAWRVTLGLPDSVLPPDVRAGAVVSVWIGDDQVMVGRVDDDDDEVGRHDSVFSLNGRDGAADLVDCAAPILTVQQIDLPTLISKLTKEFGIKKIRVDAPDARQRQKISVQPGDVAWDVLANAAEANGLWPWFEPDGTLVVGRPDYTLPPVATLTMRRDGVGNNLESLRRHRSITERFSHLTVLGQTPGTSKEAGKRGLGATYKDNEMLAIAYRPRIVVDHESDNLGIAADRARKLISDGRLKGFLLTAKVTGHRIVAPGEPGHGRLWQPGQRVRVVSERHKIDGVFFLMGRRFTGGRQGGQQTELRLVEDGMWVLAPHPHQRKHRKGKNAIEQGMVSDAGALDDSGH